MLAPGYREFAPPAGLRDVIACLWTRVPDGGGDVRVVPDACADVVWARGRGVVIAGPDTAAKLAPADDVIVGLRFRPGAAGAALGVPLDALRDLRVDAADIGGAWVLPPDAEPLDVARALVRAATDAGGDRLVQAAVARVERDPVRTIADDLGVSERQLRRRFHAAVGYGPKTLARILRFQRFVGAVDRGGDDVAALAYAAGYADQAHLTRECTRLAGLPPAAFMRDRDSGPPAAGTAAHPTR